jgi:hypothetical protein
LAELLTTNSALYYAGRVLESDNPLEDQGPYRLLDLANVLQSVVLFDRILMIHSPGTTDTELGRRLRQDGLLDEVELPTESEMFGILQSARQRRYDPSEKRFLATPLGQMLNLDPSVIARGMETTRSFTDGSMVRTPPSGQGRNELKSWLSAFNTPDDEGTDSAKGFWSAVLARKDPQHEYTWKQSQNRLVAEVLFRGEIYIEFASLGGYDYLPDLPRLPLARMRARQFNAVLGRWKSMSPRLLEMFRRSRDVARMALAQEIDAVMAAGIEPEVRFPPIFEQILSNSQKKDDLLNQALRLHEARDAAAFRKWAASFDSRIGVPEPQRIREALRELRDVERSSKLADTLRIAVVPPIGSIASWIATNGLGTEFERGFAAAGVAVTSGTAAYLLHRYRKPYRNFWFGLEDTVSGLAGARRDLERVFGGKLNPDYVTMLQSVLAGAT